MAKVAFNNVSKSFDDKVQALKQFSLTIEDGEFVVLVGPSGCGKSTALRLLAGLEAATEGDILIDDEAVNNVSPQRRNIAMVFQNYALYPHMTVRANLEFPLKMSKKEKSSIENKVSEIAEILNLTDLLERKPKQLSGGQRQRAAMGRALVRDPSVFLLDEPLSNLDAKLRAQIRAEIAQIQKRLNKTTLYVTHDQVEAMTLGDRVVVMNQGELQQLGTPEELYENPQNIFVARFIGSPGMNIMASTLTRDTSSHLSINLGEQSIALPTRDSGLEQYIDQQVYAGIRPEALSVSRQESHVGIKVSVLSVEYLGYDSLVYFQFSDSIESPMENHTFIARIAGKYFAPDNTDQSLFIDPTDIYLFNDDGMSIQIDKSTQ